MAIYVPIPGVDWRVLNVDGAGVPISASNPLPTSAVAGTSGGVVSTVNSTATPLTNGATFTGTGEDVSGYALITVAIFADQIPAASGIKLQFSKDNTNWDVIADFGGLDFGATGISVGHTYKVVPAAQFFRLVYVNGATPQAVFRVQTVYHSGGVPEMYRILDATSGLFSYVRSANSLPQNFAGGTQPAFVGAIRNGATNHDIILTAKAANTNADGVGVPASGPLTTSDAGTTWKALLGNTDGSLPSGGFTKLSAVTVVTSANTYSAGQAIGGLNTLTNAVRLAAGSGTIQFVSIQDKDKQSAAIDVLFFKASITAPTDHATFNPGNTDLFQHIGTVPVTTYSALSANSVGTSPTVALPFVLASGTSLFAALVCRGAPTYTGTSSLQLTTAILQD